MLAIVAGLGLAVAGHTAPATTQSRPAATHSKPTVSHVRPPNIVAPPSVNCYSAARTCSFHPCVEFVVDRAVPSVNTPAPTPPVCNPQPSARGRNLYVGQYPASLHLRAGAVQRSDP
jgi:hypothetical protein